ncbi:MAG TPA: hypothetical protein VKQ36_17730, partial [Ktedonobacterales bacterium]|nr:hypothetical protein [Ktedonobacterales bacterium]
LPLFAGYTLLTTVGVVFAYWLASMMQMSRFAPSRAEQIVMLLLWLAYFALVTVPTQPLALLLLPPLLALVGFALFRNRQAETQPDILMQAYQEGAISFFRTSVVLLVPLAATCVYAVALALHILFPTGIILYIITAILGFLFLIVALINVYRKAPQKQLVPVESEATTPLRSAPPTAR